MKTQTCGKSRSFGSLYALADSSRRSSDAWHPLLLFARGALINYRRSRENGTKIDNPKTAFPSAGFDTLDIKSSYWQGYDKWPDQQGRYWWKLTLNDGRVIDDYYWTKDEIRGFPDKNDQSCYWFIVHHAPSNTKIEGFSERNYYEKIDNIPKYCSWIQYTECGAIKAWMEEKDKNYLARYQGKQSVHDWILSETQNSASSSSSSSQVHDSLAVTMKPLTTCSITELVMAEPVSTLAGHTYEKEAIEKWLETNETDPLSGEHLDDKRLIRSQHLITARDSWFKQTPSHWHNPELIYLPKVWQTAMVEEGLKQSNREVMSRYLERHPSLLTLCYDAYQDETLIQLFCRYGDINDFDWLAQQWETCQKGCTQYLLEKQYLLLEDEAVSLYTWGINHLIPIKKLMILFNHDENKQPGDTLLHYAARNSEMRLADLLLTDHSEMIDRANEGGKTALCVAIEASHFGLAENLLNEGANPATYCDREDRWLLEIAMVNQAPTEFIQSLLNHGASAYAKNSSRRNMIKLLEEWRESQLAMQLRLHAYVQKAHMPRQLWEMQQQVQTMQTTIARQESLIEQLLKEVGLQMKLPQNTGQFPQKRELLSQATTSDIGIDSENQSKKPNSPQSTFFAKPAASKNKGKKKVDAQPTDDNFYDYPKKEDKPSNG